MKPSILGTGHGTSTGLIHDRLGSQHAAQLRDAAKRVVPRRVYREFRLRVYPSDTATCTVSVLLG